MQKVGHSFNIKCYDLTIKFIIAISAIKKKKKGECHMQLPSCHHGTQQMTATAITANNITGTQMILS